MSKQLILWGTLALLLGPAAGPLAAATPFSARPTFDCELGNDGSLAPTAASNTGTGLGIRNIGTRRRVTFCTYDIANLRGPGQVFMNVKLSLLGYDPGAVNVYGVLEPVEHLVLQGMNWNTAPGVQNEPTPPSDSAVALDLKDLTPMLLSFAAPARGVALTTDVSPALADFLNSDTDGFVALMFAPEGAGNAIIRSIEYGQTGGILIQGEVGGQPMTARDPVPPDGIGDVYVGTLLSWTPGTYAVTHNVYFGASAAEVEAASAAAPGNALASVGQVANTYDPPGALELGKTYYWRVDEVNAPPGAAIQRGKVWSFTTEIPLYQVTGIVATASSAAAKSEADKTVNNSGLTNGLHATDSTTMWLSDLSGPQPTWIQYAFDAVYKLKEMRVWNYNSFFESVLGYGMKNVTIESSTDGVNWTVWKDVQLAQGPATDGYAANTIVDLGGLVARYLRLTAKSNWGGLRAQYGLSEVQFFYVPVSPRQPNPADGATGVAVDATLSWRPGREAVSHQVYLGTDRQAVADGTAPVQTVTGYTFDPGPLRFGTTCYWKVAEVNQAATPPVWTGAVWSFATTEFAVVDDFESYNDTDHAIFNTWFDDFDPQGDQSGAVISNDPPPYAEQTVIHGGQQSMPLHYHNAGPKHVVSETERSWDTPQDWTAHGIDTLRLWFCGQPVGFTESAAGQITMSGIGTDISGTADQFRFAGKQLTGNGTMIAKVESLDNADPWSMAGVMIRDSFDPGSRFAAVVVTSGQGVRYRARLVTMGSATSDTVTGPPAAQVALKAPVWIKIERVGDVFNAYYSADGVQWTSMAWNPQTIPMNNPAYIGLAVTSHTVAAATTARFSGIATTGNVSGAWDVQAIGAAQPANGAAPLYVTLQDGGGRSKTVVYPDPAATNLSTWQLWQIPLADFSAAGVRLTGVQKLFLGVGDRSNPKPGGSGVVFFDDIGLGHPAGGNP